MIDPIPAFKKEAWKFFLRGFVGILFRTQSEQDLLRIKAAAIAPYVFSGLRFQMSLRLSENTRGELVADGVRIEGTEGRFESTVWFPPDASKLFYLQVTPEMKIRPKKPGDTGPVVVALGYVCTLRESPDGMVLVRYTINEAKRLDKVTLGKNPD